VHSDERGGTCAGILIRTAEHFAEIGARTERVMTDQARNFTVPHELASALTDLDAAHLITRPYRPQASGPNGSTTRCSRRGPTRSFADQTPPASLRSLAGSKSQRPVSPTPLP